MLCLSLTIPRPQCFIDARVWISCHLCAGVLLLVPAHPRTERVAPGAAFRLGRFQIHPLLFGGGSTLGIQATLGILAFFPLPCWTLSHKLPLLLRLNLGQRKYRWGNKYLRRAHTQEVLWCCMYPAQHKCLCTL